MTASKHYKTMDIIGYLKSVLEDAKPYARMKLMVVGVQVMEEYFIRDVWVYQLKHKNIQPKRFRGLEKQPFWNI